MILRKHKVEKGNSRQRSFPAPGCLPSEEVEAETRWSMIKGCLAGILPVLSLLVPLWAFPPGEDSDFERTRPVKTSVDGVSVYAFGDTFVYGVSPDFTNSLKIQEGNDKPLRKIRPKKSWEISSNKLGATTPRLPRTQAHEIVLPDWKARKVGVPDEAAPKTSIALSKVRDR